MMFPVLHSNNWLDNAFNDFFDDSMMPRMKSTAPAINVKETKEGYEVEVAAPGMNKSDLDVHINDDGYLCIKMEHKDEKKDDKKENKNSHYLRREFNYTNYEQNLILPDDVDTTKISAKMENGVLTVALPKKEEKKQEVQRKIDVA